MISRKPMNFHSHLMLGGGYFVEIITTPVPLGVADEMFVLTDRNNPESTMVVLQGVSIDSARLAAMKYLKDERERARRERGTDGLLDEIMNMDEDNR